MMMGTRSRALHRLVILGALTGVFWSLNAAAADASKQCPRPEETEDPIADLRNDYTRSLEPVKGFNQTGCTVSKDAVRAFMVGADQGLSGKRYAAFYDRGTNNEAEYLACREYGHLKTDQGNSAVNLEELSFEMSSEDAKIVAEAIKKDYGDVSERFQKFRDDELHRLKSKPAAPDIRMSDINRKQIRQIKPEYQPYACCVAGYLNGFTALHARASASATPACSKTARCKDYYTKGKEVGEKVCAGKDCKDCQLKAVGTDKDPLYGCMSAGYLDAVVNSKECKQKAATNEWYKGEVNNYTSLKQNIDQMEQGSLDKINPRPAQAQPGTTQAVPATNR